MEIPSLYIYIYIFSGKKRKNIHEQDRKVRLKAFTSGPHYNVGGGIFALSSPPFIYGNILQFPLHKICPIFSFPFLFVCWLVVITPWRRKEEEEELKAFSAFYFRTRLSGCVACHPSCGEFSLFCYCWWYWPTPSLIQSLIGGNFHSLGRLKCF